MIIGTEVDNPILIGGGVAGILAFVASMTQVLISGRVWLGLVREIRQELTDCREGRIAQTKAHAEEREEWKEERAGFEERCETLGSEVIQLRQELHTDLWTSLHKIQTEPPQKGT